MSLLALFNEGRYQEVADRVRLLAPDPVALNIAGAANVALKRPDAALEMFDLAIQSKPDFAMAYYNRGTVLQAVGRVVEALASFDQTILIKPEYLDAHYNRGNALRHLGRPAEALASYDRALRLDPGNLGAHNNRGVVLHQLRRLDEAIASFDRALEIKPDLSAALSQAMHLRAQICDWSRGDEIYPIDGPPLAGLAFEDNPERQLLRSQAQVAVRSPPVAFAEPSGSSRLRLGYFSADFHNHATMSLLAGMFEQHDRERFEVHAFSYGPHAADEGRQRLLGAVEHFHDVRALSDEQIAASARDNALDIAIDLKGYTSGGRPEIFAYRAAPVQMLYMGFPGPAGQPFIDHVIADRVVVPEENRRFFTEQVIYLPDSYFVNDDQRAISDAPQSREAQGLPAAGFVFCCFNQAYKISPAEFDIWMRLLTKVEGSVLWLLKDNHWAEANLRKEAAVRGVDPERLIFAERVPETEHLARHRCADLFLDTFNYNAHTTACDALWTGLPVVTKLGKSFAARVGGSLLYAINLPELVTTTPEDYEQLALGLATDPDKLAEIKAKLADNRLTTPLFDTERFTRNIEQAYEKAFGCYVHGSKPDHLTVAQSHIAVLP